MGTKTKFAYGAAILVPLILAWLVYDIRGDIYELTGNMRIAQFLDREGEVSFPQDILFVERHVETRYLDKPTGSGSILVFGQRNPDLPKYSVFFKILGENPDDMKAHYHAIIADFKTQASKIIQNIKDRRLNELGSLKKSIEVMEAAKTKSPESLRDGESYMSIYKQLLDLKEKREFLEISLNEISIFDYYSLDEPVLKKKRDKGIFVISLILGCLFMISFGTYLVWRISELKKK